MAYGNSIPWKSEHAGKIMKIKNKFTSVCKGVIGHCKYKGNPRKYRYEAMQDLFDHFIKCHTLIENFDDKMIDKLTFLLRGLEGQSRNRHMLR